MNLRIELLVVVRELNVERPRLDDPLVRVLLQKSVGFEVPILVVIDEDTSEGCHCQEVGVAEESETRRRHNDGGGGGDGGSGSGDDGGSGGEPIICIP